MLSPKTLISAFLITLLASPGYAATLKFSCEYKNKSEVLFTIKGDLDDKQGGKLLLDGSYVTGSSFEISKTFYRKERKNEQALRFAKFDNKSPQEEQKGVWLSVYYKFSLPKDVFQHADQKFLAYFTFYKSESEDKNLEEELPKMDCVKL